MKRLIMTFCMVLFATSAFAATLDFNDSSNLGLTLGGDATFDSRGGGHIYMETFNSDDYLTFSTPTFVNSFMMNGLPWEGYTGGTIDLIKISAFDILANEIWSEVVDLTGYDSWDSWLTVSVETAAISSFTFYATGYGESPYDGYGFWPSIDNMVISEVAVGPVATPEPGTFILAGLGLLSLIGFRRLGSAKNEK